ncbi:MAG: beta-ketoacyl-[acyl-carrier-protein] synthase family protein [Candidatus Omnitrophica bacterium]|nr:beta-ketoacyl-[acyl-carrier-protein] synthase family protein [Candidatus Omnitrophota bacterium]
MTKRRVVVTGLGAVTSIGIGKDEFWSNLIAGKSGIDDISNFHTSKYLPQKGGRVKNFTPSVCISQEAGRASQFAIEATSEALEEANFLKSDIKKSKMGAIFGTTNGESHILEEINRIWVENGESDVWARTIAKYPLDCIVRSVASHFKISGFSCMIPTACAAANYSIGYASDLIGNNTMDAMICGGSDPLTRYAFAGFARLFAMAPEKCQPFDKNRKGMMVGEGAGVLLLEDYQHARKRNAHIYAEVLGYGLSCDAYHMTAPSVDGIVKVMERAIRNSGIEKGEVGYICAHGTGTPANDKAECAAIKKVFENSIQKVSISSIKSMLGHTMGAASAIEAIACILSLANNIIPPTINHETHDSEFDGIDFVPNKAKEKEISIALNNSFAFGGNNACVAFKKYGK